MEYDAFPAGELICQGIKDIQAEVESPQALLVAIGRPRLVRIGVSVPEFSVEFPEMRLYEYISRTDSDAAHSRYNALIRRLVSFERAVECAG